jgi:hypothetical protein
LDQVETDWVLFRVYLVFFHDHTLLLLNCVFEVFHPFEDVSVGYSQLVSFPNFNQGLKGLLILVVTQFKGKLLNFKLPLKQVHRIFILWFRDPIHRHTIGIKAESG